MVATLATNPYAQTNAPGSFFVSSVGFIQGTFLDDPAVRNELAGGVLAQTEVTPMWGGVGISEATAPAAAGGVTELGGNITRATTITANAAGKLTGFSVFNQDHAMVTTPQSPVPLIGSGGLVNFFRLGSGARIAVACDPSLAAVLDGNVIEQQVSWDFSGQQLSKFNAAFSAATITNAVFASGQVTFTTSAPHGIGVGVDIQVTGVNPAGYNGFYTTQAGTTGSTIVVNLAASPGAYVSGGSVPAGGGALPVKVLDVEIGNSQTVTYNTTTGLATWNRSGSTAVILI